MHIYLCGRVTIFSAGGEFLTGFKFYGVTRSYFSPLFLCLFLCALDLCNFLSDQAKFEHTLTGQTIYTQIYENTG